MNKIKWIGPKHYPSFGVCETGQIVTEDQVSHEVMEKWVAQGLAEFVNDEQVKEQVKEPVKETIKKRVRREA